MDAIRLGARDLSVTIGGTRIVDAASFDLAGGQLVALIGPNGAGKTTLLRALAGLVPMAGTLQLLGRGADTFSRRERAQRIAYLPQGHQVHWPLSVRDVVALGRYAHGLNDPARMSDADAAIIAAAMARTEVSAFTERPVQTLSGGEKARVMLARVFAAGAPILLADEPNAALDPRHQLALMADLKREAARGTLVISATHDLGLAARMADYVLMMEGGRIVAQGAPSAVLTPERLKAVYGIEVLTVQHQGESVLIPWSAA